ncbi:MAG: serine/threonine-protein kinase [Vicinamibacteria bacterium]
MKLGKFGKFEIEKELGQGAMGKVYQARDPDLDRLVALKTVSPALLKGKDTLARFQREARAAARLQHPNIVTIFEVGEVEGTRYIAMELVDGIELGEAIHPTDRFPIAEKIRMIVDVCRGLEFAHKMGVIHRDVKPPNILVTREGVVKILDFGIARSLGEANMTQTGMVLGTPSYLSPEVLRGEKVDHGADMWAVGVILYEMLSGRRPFEAKTIPSVIHKIVNGALPSLDAKKLDVPEALVAVAARALEKKSAHRYRSLAEMERALLAAIGSTPSPDIPLDPSVRRRGYERNFAEARRLMTEEDYSGALGAARRAQSLEPDRSGIVALIKVIEARLGAAVTVRRLPTPASGVPTSPSRSIPPSEPPTPTPSSGVPMAQGPLDSATLRAHGAGALSDKGAFGEPPGTKEIALSPVADLLAAAGSDGALRLWDLRSRTRSDVLRTALHQRSGHDAAALALAFSPDGSLLASGHVDGSVHLWDMATGEAVRLRHDDSVSAVAFSPDGVTLATGSLDSNLRLWDVGAALAGDTRRKLLRQPSPITALAWTGGGESILTGHTSRVLRLIDPQRGRLLATLRGPTAQVTQLVLSPDGRSMAVASRDRTIRLIEIETRQETAVLALRRPASALCFLSDGGFLASVGFDNSVQLWDLKTRSPAAALWGPRGEIFMGLALYGELNHLAVALEDGRIRIWGPAT